MAVNFTPEHSRTSEYRFLPEDIVIKPELNGRHELPDIEWLIESIVLIGQQQAVIIRAEASKPVLSAGFSRWRAVAEINRRKLTTVPLTVRCTYSRGNELDGFLANLHENHVRNAPKPIDDAYNIKKLEAWGQTLEQIAAIYREDVDWVKSRLRLLDLAPEAQTAVSQGRIKPTATAAIAKLAKLTAKQQREIVAKDGPITAARVREVTGEKPKAKVAMRDVVAWLDEIEGDTTRPKAVREFAAQLLSKIKAL